MRAAIEGRYPARLLDELMKRSKVHRARVVQRRIASRRVKFTVRAPDIV